MDTENSYDLRCRITKNSKVSKLRPAAQFTSKSKIGQPEANPEVKSDKAKKSENISIRATRPQGEIYSLEEDSFLWKYIGSSWRDKMVDSEHNRADVVNNIADKLHRTPGAIEMRLFILKNIRKAANAAVEQGVDLSAGSADSILWSKCHGTERDSYKVLSSSAVKRLEKKLSAEDNKSQLASDVARLTLIRNLKCYNVLSGLTQLETEAAAEGSASFSEAPSASSPQLKPQKRAKRAKLASSLSQETSLPLNLPPPLPLLTLPLPLPLHCLLEGGVAVPPDEPEPAVEPMHVPPLPPPVLQPVPMLNRLLSPATASNTIPGSSAAAAIDTAVDSPTLKVNKTPPPSPPLPFECAFMFSKAEIESIWRIYTRNVKNNVVQEPDLTLDLCSLAEDLACTYPQIKARLQLLLDLDQRHVVLPKK